MASAAARTVAFISNKGGVGKTHISVNLAIQMAREGRRVLLVDTDLGSAGVDLRLGVRPTAGLADFYNGKADIFLCLTNTDFGFQLLAGSRGDFGLANLPHEQKIRLLKAFNQLVQDGNYTDVLFDLGAGISHLVTDFALVADECVIVTTPTDIVPAYAALKACWTRCQGLREMEYFKDLASLVPKHPVFFSNVEVADQGGPRMNFIVNQVKDLEEGKRVFLRILQVARSFFYSSDGNWHLPIRYLGGIPDAYDLVKQSERTLSPILILNPYCPFSQAIREISSMLIGKKVLAPDHLKIPFADRVRGVLRSWSNA
jgi:MinD-like ATPase involved in chromosome partitioning or flagellar assembly